MVPDNNHWGIYLTPSIEVANMYIISQAENAIGVYGHIYCAEIDENDIIITDDIDQLAKATGVLYSIDDDYYRIDQPEKYAFKELSPAEIIL
jgi:hypothetical protein